MSEIMATDRLQSINYERMRNYRLERTKAMMRKEGIGTMITWDGFDIRYISSVNVTVPTRWIESQFVVLPANADPHVFALTSFSPYKMREELPWLKEKIWPTPGELKYKTTIDSIKPIVDTIEKIVREHGLEKEPVALDGCTSEFLVSEALKQRGLTAVDGKHCMFLARMIKNQDEIECVRMACATADAAFDAIKRAIRPGVKECELVGVGMERLYALGADETMGFVCSSGPRTNPLHIDYTDRIIRPGDLVIVDINGNSWNGYKSCYYRTFVCGKATQEQRDVFNVSKDMMYNMMAQVKAGNKLTDMHKGMPEGPQFWGYEKVQDVFPYALSHGIGISLHEYPMIQFEGAMAPGVTEFQEGMVIAVETWYGKRDGEFGVRLEENIAVTKDGYDLLTKYPIDDIIECDI